MKKVSLISSVLVLCVGMSAFAAELYNQVLITEDEHYRYVTANGIPDHGTGQFPNAGNPNAIREQNYEYRVTLNPQMNKFVTPLGHNNFGVSLNGVPFDPATAEFWNNDRLSGWNYDANFGQIDLGLDHHNAHVQPNGAYHYHAMPITGLSADDHSPIIGYAADGYPIYGIYGYLDPEDPSKGVRPMISSYRLKEGERPGGPGGIFDGRFVEDYEYIAESGDLNFCNGRHTVTPDYPEGVFAYFITKQFPVIPRCLVGTPDESFIKGPPGDGHMKLGTIGKRPPVHHRGHPPLPHDRPPPHPHRH